MAFNQNVDLRYFIIQTLGFTFFFLNRWKQRDTNVWIFNTTFSTKSWYSAFLSSSKLFLVTSCVPSGSPTCSIEAALGLVLSSFSNFCKLWIYRPLKLLRNTLLIGWEYTDSNRHYPLIAIFLRIKQRTEWVHVATQ